MIVLVRKILNPKYISLNYVKRRSLFLCCNSFSKQFEALDLRRIKENLEEWEIFCRDNRIIYNSYIDSNKIRISQISKNKFLRNFEKLEEEKQIKNEEILPVFMKDYINIEEKENLHDHNEKVLDSSNKHLSNENDISSSSSFPYDKTEKVEHQKIEIEEIKLLKEPIIDWNPPEITIKEDIKKRLEMYDSGELKTQVHFDTKDVAQKERGFDYLLEHMEREMKVQRLLGKSPKSSTYGTPNSEIPESDIPCGGCGAELHCQEPNLPGE